MAAGSGPTPVQRPLGDGDREPGSGDDTNRGSSRDHRERAGAHRVGHHALGRVVERRPAEAGARPGEGDPQSEEAGCPGRRHRREASRRRECPRDHRHALALTRAEPGARRQRQ